jgi:hypothetical protein
LVAACHFPRLPLRALPGVAFERTTECRSAVADHCVAVRDEDLLDIEGDQGSSVGR